MIINACAMEDCATNSFFNGKEILAKSIKGQQAKNLRFKFKI
jgi:hypothetical protein